MTAEFHESDGHTRSDSTTDAGRPPSLLDATCDGYVYDLAALSPTDATAWQSSRACP